MEPCTILDLGKLSDITSSYKDIDIFTRLRLDLSGQGSTTWFMMDDCCIGYEFIQKHTCQVHIYSVSRDRRGRELRNFAIRAGRWMVDNTDATTFLNFVDKDRLDLRIFMKMIGSKKLAVIPGTNQILYASTEDMGIEENI